MFVCWCAAIYGVIKNNNKWQRFSVLSKLAAISPRSVARKWHALEIFGKVLRTSLLMLPLAELVIVLRSLKDTTGRTRCICCQLRYQKCLDAHARSAIRVNRQTTETAREAKVGDRIVYCRIRSLTHRNTQSTNLSVSVFKYFGHIVTCVCL